MVWGAMTGWASGAGWETGSGWGWAAVWGAAEPMTRAHTRSKTSWLWEREFMISSMGKHLLNTPFYAPIQGLPRLTDGYNHDILAKHIRKL